MKSVLVADSLCCYVGDVWKTRRERLLGQFRAVLLKSSRTECRRHVGDGVKWNVNRGERHEEEERDRKQFELNELRARLIERAREREMWGQTSRVDEPSSWGARGGGGGVLYFLLSRLQWSTNLISPRSSTAIFHTSARRWLLAEAPLSVSHYPKMKRQAELSEVPFISGNYYFS